MPKRLVPSCGRSPRSSCRSMIVSPLSSSTSCTAPISSADYAEALFHVHLIHKSIRSRADKIRDGLYPEYYTGVHDILISKESVRLILKEIDTTVYNTSVNNMFYFIFILRSNS